MQLSRKRQKELNKLKRSAGRVWDEQREALDHATEVLQDARRQAANFAREEVSPRVSAAYEDRVRPAVVSGLAAAGHAASTARERFSDDVLPSVTGAIGSALAALEAARDPRVRDLIKQVSSAGQKAGSKVGLVAPPKKSAGPGRYILIGLGVVAALGVAYAAWQTLRADDDLWIEDLGEADLTEDDES